MKKLIGAIGVAAFLFALSVVGGVERGADAAQMWWTLPCLVIMSASALYCERR